MFFEDNTPKIPTAEEYFFNFSVSDAYDNLPAEIKDIICRKAISFAELHLKAAQEKIFDQAEIVEVKKVEKYDYADSSNYGVSKQSILNAYPAHNIK